MVEKLFHMGCYEVSLGDTIGVGTVNGTRKLLAALANIVSLDSIAVHFHDTYGQALPNIKGSIGAWSIRHRQLDWGLGGCPYASGASGNVATEDVVYMLDGMGVKTGINLDSLIKVSEFVFAELQRPPASRVAKAILSKLN